MRTFMVLLCLILAFGGTSAQNESNAISYSGVYKGAPLFIQNPYLSSEGTYCIKEIYINERRANINYQRSALMLNFSSVQQYSPVSIRIVYSDSTCTPILLNPDAIRYHSIFSFEKVVISDSSIHWQTKGEQPEGTYEIESFNLGYWEPLETFSSKGVFGGSSYEFFPVYEEGPNKFRVKYSNGDETLYSQEIEHVFYPEPVTFKRVGSKIILSRACEYVVTDEQNFDILTGSGKEIDISTLGNGEFYLIFDEEQAELFRKNDNVKVIRKSKDN